MNPAITGQFVPIEEMVEFLHRAGDLELVIVYEKMRTWRAHLFLLSSDG